MASPPSPAVLCSGPACCAIPNANTKPPQGSLLCTRNQGLYIPSFLWPMSCRRRGNRPDAVRDCAGRVPLRRPANAQAAGAIKSAPRAVSPQGARSQCSRSSYSTVQNSHTEKMIYEEKKSTACFLLKHTTNIRSEKLAG